MQYGCLVVLKRKGGNHVGFYTGEKGDSVYLLGGNQSDKVCVTLYKKDLILSTRFPTELNETDQAIFDVVGIK